MPPPPVSAPPKRSVSKTVDIFDDEFESEGENDDPPITNYKLELEKVSFSQNRAAHFLDLVLLDQARK